MIHIYANKVSNDVWFADSGCSDHTINYKSLFKELDESQKLQVRLEDNKQMQVDGKGIIVVKTSNGKVKLLSNVFFVPNFSQSIECRSIKGQWLCSRI